MNREPLPGLAERRQARIAERYELQKLRRLASGVRAYPKGEQRDRHRALVFFATLPTKHLVAVHKAALQYLENETPS